MTAETAQDAARRYAQMGTAGATGSTTEQDKSRHRNEMADATSDLKDDLRHLKHDATRAGVAARDAARDGFEQIGEAAYDQKANAEQAIASMRTTVRRHPATAMLVALGVGAMLGKVLGR